MIGLDYVLNVIKNMPKQRILNFQGLNLKLSPYLQTEGELLRCVNMSDDLIGAKEKRPGYAAYLGTADNSAIDSIWNFQLNNGTQFWNYRASGGSIYYSQQGTGAWTICGGGTMTSGTPIFNAISENTMLLCDGGSATRHTTNGTSFTNTTSAPIARGMVDYQNRIYAIGTASTFFWSNAGTPTDWTNDSSSINIPGPGRLHTVMKVADRAVVSKNSGIMHRWDGFNLIDLATNLGPSSPQSLANVEDFRFYLNRLGIFGYGGNKPEIISNHIEKQIYNDAGLGIAGTSFNDAMGIAYKYNYYLSVGTITDDLTYGTVSNAILKYNYQLNQWSNYTFADRPTAWGTYQDANGSLQLLFGNSGGQVFTYGGTVTTDNTATIEAIMEFVIHGGMPETDKKWNYFWAFFNPGNQAKVQVAISDTFTLQKKKWVDLGDCSDGIAEFRFPEGSRGKLLFVKIYEASRNNRFQFLGVAYDADPIDRR